MGLGLYTASILPSVLNRRALPRFTALTALAVSLVGCLPVPEGDQVLKAAQREAIAASAKHTDYAAISSENNEAPSPEVGVSKMAVGKQHVCAIKNGSLYCWGLNLRGQIGSGADRAGGDEKTPKIESSPFLVFSDGTPNDVTDVAVGLDHTCAIRSSHLFCWGSNEYGQAGLGDVKAIYPTPQALLPSETFTQVVARALYTCAVSTAGKLYCWGARPVHVGATLQPKSIATAPLALDTGTTLISKVAMSEYHACFLSNLGGVSCWGINGSGEIGNGDARGLDVNEPYEVFSGKATQIALSEGRTCALVDGGMKCWGSSLGDRSQDSSKSTDGWNVRTPLPYDSVFFSKVTPLRKMSSRGAVLSDDAKLYYGSYLHFDGSPKVIADGVVDFDYSEAEIVGCVMFKNRKVKCWGSNLFGQFGNGASGSSDAHANWFQATEASL